MNKMDSINTISPYKKRRG